MLTVLATDSTVGINGNNRMLSYTCSTLSPFFLVFVVNDHTMANQMKLNLSLMPCYMYYKTSVASVLQPRAHSIEVCPYLYFHRHRRLKTQSVEPI